MVNDRVIDPVEARLLDAIDEADAGSREVYADWLGISEAKAKRTRDDFFPKVSIDPDKVVGLDSIVQDAVTLKFTAAPLTKEQLAELMQIPPR